MIKNNFFAIFVLFSQVHLIAAPRCVVVRGFAAIALRESQVCKHFCQPITSPRMELRSAVAMTTARLLSQPPSPPGARPNILWQKWNERACIPDAVFEQARLLAPEYEHAVLDDADSDRFVRERLGSAVAQRYSALAKTQKADLLRFGLLLHFGGVWLDVDAPMVIPLDAVFPDRALSYSAFSAFAGIMLGLMASPPGLPIYREALDDIVRTDQVHVDRGAHLSQTPPTRLAKMPTPVRSALELCDARVTLLQSPSSSPSTSSSCSRSSGGPAGSCTRSAACTGRGATTRSRSAPACGRARTGSATAAGSRVPQLGRCS